MDKKPMSKNMFLLLLLLLLSSWAPVSAQVLRAQPSLEDLRIKKSQAFSVLFSQFLTQPDPDICLQLAQALRKDDKPIPALEIIKFGIALFEQNSSQPSSSLEQLISAQREFEQRIVYLKERYAFFQSEVSENGRSEAYGGMAAIKFHLGFIRDAMRILDHAIQTKGNNVEFDRLKHFFFMEIQLNSTAYLKLVRAFDSECEKGNFSGALQLVSKMCYIGIYSENPLEILEKLKQTFPDNVNTETLQIVQSMPSVLRQNNFATGN